MKIISANAFLIMISMVVLLLLLWRESFKD